MHQIRLADAVVSTPLISQQIVINFINCPSIVTIFSKKPTDFKGVKNFFSKKCPSGNFLNDHNRLKIN
jgi:hypothetical protein